MSIGYALAMIAVAAVCTFATRVAPFLLFNGKKPIPPIIRYLGATLPPAVIALLVVYCLKNVGWVTDTHGVRAAVRSADRQCCTSEPLRQPQSVCGSLAGAVSGEQRAFPLRCNKAGAFFLRQWTSCPQMQRCVLFLYASAGITPPGSGKRDKTPNGFLIPLNSPSSSFGRDSLRSRVKCEAHRASGAPKVSLIARELAAERPPWPGWPRTVMRANHVR